MLIAFSIYGSTSETDFGMMTPPQPAIVADPFARLREIARELTVD